MRDGGVRHVSDRHDSLQRRLRESQASGGEHAVESLIDERARHLSVAEF